MLNDRLSRSTGIPRQAIKAGYTDFRNPDILVRQGNILVEGTNGSPAEGVEIGGTALDRAPAAGPV